jgi:hypothetical protein
MKDLLEFILKTYYRYFPNSFYSELPDEKDPNHKVVVSPEVLTDQAMIERAVNIIYKDVLTELSSEEYVTLALKSPAFVFGLLDESTWDEKLISRSTYQDIAARVDLPTIIASNPSFLYYQLKFPVIQSITPLVVDEKVDENGWHDPNYYTAKLFMDDRIDYLHSLEEGTELGFHKEVNLMTNHEENICQQNFRLGLFQFLYATEKYPDDFQHDSIFQWIKDCLSFGDLFRLMIESITVEYYKANVDEGKIWDLMKTNNEMSKKVGIEFKPSRYIVEKMLDYAKAECKDKELVTLMTYL